MKVALGSLKAGEPPSPEYAHFQSVISVLTRAQELCACDFTWVNCISVAFVALMCPWSMGACNILMGKLSLGSSTFLRRLGV